jgi:hypothetical protein
LLHAIFDELVNYVEIELAWMSVAFSEEEQKKYKTPWYHTIFRIRAWHCPDAGIAYLNGRGRNTSHLMPPAQIRTCSITAYGSY